MIKVIGFDLDETLWDVDPVLLRAQGILNDWLKARVPNLVNDAVTLQALREKLLEQDPGLVHRLTEFRQRMIELTMMNSGVPTKEAKQLAASAMEVFLVARNEITFYEGALAAITHLAGKYALGALTNGNADIHRLGLGEHFSFAFSAEDVGASKPAPDLFHAALEHTGCQPDEMIFVGDDPVRDVDAANQVGLHTIWFKNRKLYPGETEPTATIQHLRDLPDAVSHIEHS